MKPNTPGERAAVVMAAARGRKIRAVTIRPPGFNRVNLEEAEQDAENGHFDFAFFRYEIVEPRLVLQGVDLPPEADDGVSFLCFADCDEATTSPYESRAAVLRFRTSDARDRTLVAVHRLRQLAAFAKGGRS